MLTYYAAPDGTGDGLTPFTPGTIATARALAAANSALDDITIYLRGGRHTIATPIALSEADSGQNGHRIAWKAYPGETPSISGGRQVSGWFRPDSAGKPWLWAAMVADGLPSRQLYVNGTRARRAKWAGAIAGYGIAGAPLIETPATDIELVFNGLALGMPKPWVEPRRKVASLTQVGGDVSFVAVDASLYENYIGMLWSVGFPSEPSAVENAYEFLGAASKGSFYYNASPATVGGVAGPAVFYVPRDGEDMTTADVWLPQVEHIIKGVGTISHVDFDDIIFEHATWLGIERMGGLFEIQGNCFVNPELGDTVTYWDTTPAMVELSAVDAAFTRCTFQRSGACGLHIRLGSADVDVQRCTVRDVSSTGMRVGTSDWAHSDGDIQTSHISITRCTLIDDVATEFAAGEGIWAGFVDHLSVLNNDIAHLPYAAISVGWQWAPAGYNHNNVVAYNRIDDVMRVLDDGAAIYTLANEPGMLVHDNYITFRMPFVGSGLACLYTDNGSNGVSLYNNICIGGRYWSFGNPPGVNYWGVNYKYSTQYQVAGGDGSGSGAGYDLAGADPGTWPPEVQAIASRAGVSGVEPGLPPPAPEGTVLIGGARVATHPAGEFLIATSRGIVAIPLVMPNDSVRFLVATSRGLRGIK